MNSSSINDQPTKLFLISLVSYFVQYFSFFGFSWLNALLALELKESWTMDSSLQGIILINAITHWNFQVVYFVILLVIYFRLRIVKDFLATIFEQHQSSEYLGRKFKSVGCILDSICDALESIKFCYTINTVNYTLQFVFMLTLSIYSVISYACHFDSTQMDWIYMLIIVAWTSVFTPLAISLFAITIAIKKQAKAVGEQIHSVLQEKTSSLIVQKKAELLFLQLEHRQIFVSCGYFEVGWFLLFHLFGMIYSYVLIIIQFELHTFF
jgi:hypothetical protein